MARVVAALAASGLLVAAKAAGLPDAMAADDECAATGGGPDCALNEVQLRANRRASGKMDPLEQPKYCQHLLPGMPVPPWCAPGVKTCLCAERCKKWVRSMDWGYDPQCCGCSGEGAETHMPANMPMPNFPGSMPMPTLPGFPPMPPAGLAKQAAPDTSMVEAGMEVHPIYCSSMPAGVTSPYCSPGVNTCGCHAYCTASVAPSNWGWDPNCCGCGAAANAANTCAVFGCGNYRPGQACQCNNECTKHGNCCHDAATKCGR